MLSLLPLEFLLRVKLYLRSQTQLRTIYIENHIEYQTHTLNR